MYTRSKEYEQLMLEVIEEHEDLQWITHELAIDCLSSDRDKSKDGFPVLGECIKVQELYKEYCPFDFLIVIYGQNCVDLTAEQMRILMYHELLHVDMSEKDGMPVYRVRPHDVQDFREIIDEYGIDWASAERR